MKLQQIVQDSEDIYLSGEDVLELTDHRCRIIKYSDLMFISSIDEILDVQGSVIILYQKEENSGHFCMLTNRYKNGSLYFFDPYAYDIDEEIKLADFQIRHMHGQIVPHLTHLIQSSNYDLIVNKIQYQEFKDHINTCGRHCVTRLNYIHLDDAEYNTFINKNSHYDADFWVSVLTVDFHNYI
jgi:hypothetical protein